MKSLLFDLDGTVANPLNAFASSIFYAFDEMKLPRASIETIRKAIGPPLYETMSTIFNLPPELHTPFLDHYRKHHGDIGIKDYTIYPGIEDLLKMVQGKYHVYLATSKPHVYAQAILKSAKLDKYFDYMHGSEMNGVNSKKGDLISYILRSEMLKAQDCYMIGDRKHDILGAKANTMKSIGVLWGFGDEAELKEAGADFIISKPIDLLKLSL